MRFLDRRAHRAAASPHAFGSCILRGASAGMLFLAICDPHSLACLPRVHSPAALWAGHGRDVRARTWRARWGRALRRALRTPRPLTTRRCQSCAARAARAAPARGPCRWSACRARTSCRSHLGSPAASGRHSSCALSARAARTRRTPNLETSFPSPNSPHSPALRVRASAHCVGARRVRTNGAERRARDARVVRARAVAIAR